MGGFLVGDLLSLVRTLSISFSVALLSLSRLCDFFFFDFLGFLCFG